MPVDRNFRSSYFGKVGIKGVEEKKSLEIILKEHPLDTNKLTQFCLRYSLPVAYRIHVWKIILNVIPPSKDALNYVWQQRQEQFESLDHAVEVIFRDHDKMTMAETHLKMFLIEQGTLRFEIQKQLVDPASVAFLAMHNIMNEVTENEPVSCYWLTKGLFAISQSFTSLFPALVERTEVLLRKEQSDEGQLVHHLQSLDAFRLLPLTHWFRCCYAGILPENSCERIFDKVIAGSSCILVCVAVAILLNLRRPILTMKRMEDVNHYLQQIPEDSGDNIVGSAVEIWQKYGSPVHHSCARVDSPVILVDKVQGHS